MRIRTISHKRVPLYACEAMDAKIMLIATVFCENPKNMPGEFEESRLQ